MRKSVLRRDSVQTQTKSTLSHRIKPTAAALAVATCFSVSFALANPTAPVVVNGTASFATAGNILNITNSHNAIINWGSFSIGINELTKFIQPSALSAVLNRVTGQDPSAILGALQSNGRVFLLNPNGIVFGSSAQINVAGLVASTLKMSDDDFLNNRMKFTDGAGAGSVVNNGSITGGSVYLVGNAVTNNGLITSPNGEVVLAAGNSVELVNPGTPDLRVEIVAPDNEARNLGTVTAEAGRIGIYAGLINNSGTLNASSAVAEGGKILLKATRNTTLEAGSQTTANGSTGGTIEIQSGDTTLVSGAITATGSTGAGGTVHVLGNQVGLIDAASINVSGQTGGGTALVGGDYQGKNPAIQNAFRTFVGPDVTINADAIASGDGGKVIVWADDATRFYGNIAARGGAIGGNGGFAEVSSKQYLDYRGLADLRASNGLVGSLLLDPSDITIVTGSEFFYGGSIAGGVFAGATSPATIAWSTIETQLGLSNLAITTSGSGGSGNITVQDGHSYTSTHDLTLLANNNITVNAFITNTGAGDILMYAGWDGAATAMPAVTLGTGNVALNAPVSTGGDMYLIAGNHVIQDSNGAVTANNLLLDGGFQGVTMNLAANSVNTLAGKGGQFFNFQNSKSLTVGAVGGVAGINVTSTSGNAATVNINLTGASVDADLTVNNNIIAQAGSGAQASITLSTDNAGGYGGAITINNAAVSALGGMLTPAYGGSYGDASNVQITAVDGLTINNSTVQALGGHAASNAQYGGGSARVDFQASAIDIKSGSVIRARGGNGASDGTNYGGDSNIDIYANGTNGVKIYNSLVEGIGGSGMSGSQQGNAFIGIGTGVSGGNIDISGSTISANGYVGDIYMSASYGGNIMVANSNVMAQGRLGADGAEGYVSLYAPSGTLDAASSTVSAFGQPGMGSGVSFSANGDITLGLVVATDTVGISSWNGAITDGNSGLNVSAPYAELYANNGVGSVANPLETQVSYLDVDSNSGGIGVINAGNLVLGAFGAGGNSAIGATGNLAVLDGGEGGSNVNGDLALLANGDLNILGSVYASGNLLLNSAGSTTVGGPDTQSYNGGVSVWGDMSTTAVAGGNLNVLRSNNYSSELGSGGLMTIKTGGNVLVDQSMISGNPDVIMDVGGVININGSAAYGGFAGGISAGSVYTIHLTFPNLTSGGFFVNGIEGVVFDPATNTGFFADGSAAVLGTNLLVTYGGGVPALTIPTDALIVAMGESSKPPDPEKDKDVFEDLKKDKEKEAPVCR